MAMATETPKRRAPIRAVGIAAARAVREAIGYHHPTDVELEVIAYMRGALVREAAANGARANLLRVGKRGIIGVAGGLPHDERRWAIAHELGHFEAHPNVSYLGLCSSADLVPDYESSGREPEANAFAAELLMPEDVFAPRCDIADLSWGAVRELAHEFQVSPTAAALRVVSFTAERLAVFYMRDGEILWSCATKDFGPRAARGARIDEWSEARAYFKTGDAAARPQTVSASTWVEDAADDVELLEHVLPMPQYRSALSLVWWKDAE